MIEAPLTDEALEWAESRIDDFYSVQGEWRELLRGLTVLREGLGLDDSKVDQLTGWVKELTGDEDYAPPILLGLMLGLIAADHLSEIGSE